MDYEPGKVPGKNEWTSQATTQSKAQNAFASNVKIVGDNVTEKDYDEFFKGFNSLDDNPLWQEKQVEEKPKINKLPYNPTITGQAKIQKLPYRPTASAEPKISLYSGVTPTYTQAKNTSQKPEETLWEKLNEKGENLLPYMSPAITLGKALESHVREKHYGRNQYNVDLPQNADEAKEWNWETELANCHQFTAPNGERHIKYVSPDGKREVIFDHTGKKVITADEDMGTYNYADPDLGLAHLIADLLPWIWYGNTPEDTTEPNERLRRSLEFGK